MSPQLFPDLNKIMFLDDDVVVQHDLSSLWEINLHGKVVGAVVDSWCGRECCPGRKYKDYFNFTNPVIASSTLDHDRCGWLYGMNVFDLVAWRKTNITAAYHQWLKLVSILSIDLVNSLAQWLKRNACYCITCISSDFAYSTHPLYKVHCIKHYREEEQSTLCIKHYSTRSSCSFLQVLSLYPN